MEFIRDFIRDIVGILFPGGLLVILILWFIFAFIVFGIAFLFIPFDLFNTLPSFNKLANFFLLVIFSYVAGQFLRMKQLSSLEKKCTDVYRKKIIKNSKEENEGKPKISHEEFEKSVASINEAKRKYFSGKLKLEELKEIYITHKNRFDLWEKFPYPYFFTGGGFLLNTEEYNKFFEKYDKQGIMRNQAFFNFCKSVIFEYSPSFKEEALRQESLIRLMAGIYYVIKYSKIINIIVGILHLVLITVYNLNLNILPRFSYNRIGYYSFGIVVISFLVLFISWYMKRGILQRLRLMRLKELSIVYNGFYIICKKYDLDF